MTRKGTRKTGRNGLNVTLCALAVPIESTNNAACISGADPLKLFFATTASVSPTVVPPSPGMLNVRVDDPFFSFIYFFCDKNQKIVREGNLIWIE